MKSTLTGRLLVRFYGKVPLSSFALKVVTRMEGGDMLSISLRAILSGHLGVTAGSYSYGSLLIPGHSDVGTVIGRYVSIGPNVRRIGAGHPMNSVSLHPFWYNSALGYVDTSMDVERGRCTIGHDSWIGANVVILPSCRTIGIGAVVGAGSVVTKDVPDFAIVVGNPAKIVRYRFDAVTRDEIAKSRYWELEPGEAQNALTVLSGERSS